RLREHVRSRIVTAAGAIPADRARRLTFALVGGGYTGTELAAELADWTADLAGGAGLAASEVRVVLVEARDRLLPGFPAGLAHAALGGLRRRGVEVRLEQPVAAVRADALLLASGERIPTETVVWSGGVRAPHLLTDLGLPTASLGRVPVDDYLSVPGSPTVSAIGDCALVRDRQRGRDLPMTAHFAVQQGEHVARVIRAELRGARPPVYRPRWVGEAISLGRDDAIAYVGPVPVRGAQALAIRSYVQQRYLYGLGGLSLVRHLWDRRREPEPPGK
ncbi:MAG: FAD-dependent oxidoreductase, partial [Chloroflexi bacterium]|nr:FAD-dependent oxidoreductase [Chloroflexota bacterium]